MSLIIRIKQLSDFFCKNPNQFAKKLGATSETIRKIYIGDTKEVKSSLLTKISEVFPEVNSEWLLTGKGEMLKEGKSQSEYGFCMDCVRKEAEIKVITKQKDEYEQKNDKLLKEIGALEEQLNKKDNNNSRATG